MSRFYVRPEDIKGDIILVSREEAHHIVDVMRMDAGDDIVAFDGTGREYFGRILSVFKGSLKIKIEKINNVRKASRIFVTLAQALPKRAKMDFIVEKATELGADEIIPLVTERTIARLTKDKQPRKGEHWQEVAISASKQCGRADIPKVRPSSKFKDVLNEAKNYDIAMMACLNENTRPLKEVIANFEGRKMLIMIGPEGDFSRKEIEAAASSGIKLVSLGRLVLRVDTAAIYLLSVLNYESNV